MSDFIFNVLYADNACLYLSGQYERINVASIELNEWFKVKKWMLIKHFTWSFTRR